MYYPMMNMSPSFDGFTIGTIAYLIGAIMFLITAVIEWIIQRYRRTRVYIDYSFMYIIGSALYVVDI